MLIFFFLLIGLLILFFIIANNKEVVNEKKVVVKEINKENAFNNNSYIKEGEEEYLKDEIIGYENELMYSNNLKEGDYINQYQEKEIIDKNDNQIGFNPKPREQMKQLPYANIHFKCL
jgi:hypothetical protein